MSEQNELKKKRERSNAYPSISLKEAIEFVKPLYDNYGTSVTMTRDNIASLLDKAAATLVMKISSCVQYKLLEVKAGEGYKVTSSIVTILKPLHESEKRSVLLECFKNPHLYELLIQEFNGHKLPSVEALPNVLFRKYGISENASEKAAKVFIDNANELSLLNESHILKINIGGENLTDVLSEQGTQLDKAIVPHILPPPDSGSLPQESKTEKKKESVFENGDNIEHDEFNVRLKGGRMAIIKMPKDADIKDFDTIINWARLNKDALYE